MRLDKLYNRNTQPEFWNENFDNHDLNCGSFALGVDTWYCPYVENCQDDEDWQYSEDERRDMIEELVFEGYEIDEIIDIVLARDFEFIMKTCPWLEPINKEDISYDDRVIAYRLSIHIPNERAEFDADECTDFHFRVLINGEWWEKNGATSAHYVGVEIDEGPWEVDDWLVYHGAIKYARFKEKV